jgi:glutathione peroxidase
MEFAADIEWNFVKFVINRDGEVVKRFPSPFDRAALEQEIELLL